MPVWYIKKVKNDKNQNVQHIYKKYQIIYVSLRSTFEKFSSLKIHDVELSIALW